MLINAQQHLAHADSVLAKLIQKYGNCKLCPRLAYDVLCDAIISQQLSLKAAITISSRFKALFKDRKLTPSQTLCISDEQLRMIGLSRAKIDYLKNLARNFKHISDISFQEMTDEEIIYQLTLFKGIGVWTAQMFLIFSLNRLDVLPTCDLSLRKAILKQYKLNNLPSRVDIERIAQKWRPYRTIAVWYLWRSIDNFPSEATEYALS
ncbi:MAG: DNA-3-methyladenine glycosylase 2 family protein [Acidobacteriota bacterium]|nr:DNA-3-methyladenine glycosylase 2 family protein [Blastocatellia bacterium]MDW8413732.1 DNA-3-methyladenine glycosylase 2 family protein [Acidobacteriota bacterium]